MTYLKKDCLDRTHKGTIPVDCGNFEKVLDILVVVEYPQLIKNLNELAEKFE
jgi:hypothetical protein